MDITIKNCNNIDSGNITIKENCLNIKYAINGAGKTTISRAIVCSANDSQNGTNELEELTPFKCIGEEEKRPELLGTEALKSIRVFDESYVDEFIFQPNELLKGSFDVFIRGEDYERGMQQIDDLVETIGKKLAADKDVDDLINDFRELSGSFGNPTKTGIHGSSRLSKAFKEGNKVVNIPSGLEDFKDYIQHDTNYKWVKWQIDGQTFIEISQNCPYCVNDIRDMKSTIRRVSEEYDPRSIENLNKIVAVFQRLSQYFSEDTKKQIDDFVTNIDGYTDEQVAYLREVRNQVDRLNEKFLSAQRLGFHSLKDVDKVIEALNRHKIDLALYSHLKSEKTKEKVDIVNKAINDILQKASELQGTINKQRILIERLVTENKEEINSFLKSAGYPYSVDLTEDDQGEYRLKLIHEDIDHEVPDVKRHLSFGERNAFSLVLFMYDALKSDPDLIILDDPISSFDKTKKYAIVDTLFRKEKFFRGRTVLMLTHDFEPIVDMVFHHTDKFELCAAFLENVRGQLQDKEIASSDIKTFVKINEDNIASSTNNLSKLIYLRRLWEAEDKRSRGFDLISNLLHKRLAPTLKENDKIRPMTTDEINRGALEIRLKIPGFDYTDILKLVMDDEKMKHLYLLVTSNYEKLHIYRIIFDDKKETIDSDIIQKFINEAFHLENDYIYQLNPRQYELVPQYVIEGCDKHIQEL